MASKLHNLSDYDFNVVPNAKGMKFGVVVSEWNDQITGALLQGCCATLIKHGVQEQDIEVQTVPGSFELIYGSACFLNGEKVDAVIAIGCVIRGDTPHFDYICEGTTAGLSALNAKGTVPVIYGLLTCDNQQQAEDRCGGSLGNKGDECAITAIKMVDFKRKV